MIEEGMSCLYEFLVADSLLLGCRYWFVAVKGLYPPCLIIFLMIPSGILTYVARGHLVKRKRKRTQYTARQHV